MRRFVLVCALLAACGSSDPCTAAVETLCLRACECAPGDGCGLISPDRTFAFADRDRCVEFFTAAHCAAEVTLDHDACGAAAGDAMCRDDGDTGEMGLAWPAACDPAAP